MRGRWGVRILVLLTALLVLAAAGLGLKRHIEGRLEPTAHGKRTVRWERDGRQGHWLPTAYAYEGNEPEPIARWEWSSWSWGGILNF